MSFNFYVKDCNTTPAAEILVKRPSPRLLPCCEIECEQPQVITPAPTPTPTPTPTPSSTPPPSQVVATDYIMCFIDEADFNYVKDTTTWDDHVNTWNTVTCAPPLNFNSNNALCFNVESGWVLFNEVKPANRTSPIEIVKSSRADPEIIINGTPLTGTWIKQIVDGKWPGVTADPSARIFVFIDNSGSMRRNAIEPAIDDFYSLISCQHAEMLCPNQSWIQWINNTAQGISGC